jgi:hypothetical protein
MASLLIARGFSSLIASRVVTQSENVGWNAFTRRDSENQAILPSVILFIWLMVNILLFLPVLFIVSILLEL